MEVLRRTILSEPRSPGAPRRVWRDWLLVGAIAFSVGLETIFRSEPPAPGLSLLIVALLVASMLVRRTSPLLGIGISYGPLLLLNLAIIVTGRAPIDPYSSIWILVVVYALFRWGSGREIIAGLGLIVLTLVTSMIGDYTGVGDAVGGTVFLLFPGAVGALIRVQKSAREQSAERIRLEERAKIARELHDTVAHHVSAIAVQAQAGRFLAGTDSPDGAADALAVIEEEASRTLVEMRTMVGLLRRSDSGSEPQPGQASYGIADLEQLASEGSEGNLRVGINRSGNLKSVSGPVSTAVFRLAQESVTNATRHAHRATRVDIRVHGGPEAIRLTVSDDGDPPSASSRPPGFGLIGMSERVGLIGGSFEAGPGPKRGWVVRAELPRNPSSS